MNVRESLHARPGTAPAVLAAGAQALQGDGETLVTPEERARMIAEAAYYLAERRGFEPGHELEDWLAAEARIELELRAAQD
jgi:hypothetical protein